MAHEIRNPLAGIASSADLLRSRLGPEDERRKLADLILSEVARLDRIVESLLRFARPAEPSHRREDVVPCLVRALRLIEDALQMKEEMQNLPQPPDLCTSVFFF